MSGKNLTDVRKFFIINSLSDGEKRSTQDLISRVNKNLLDYFDKQEYKNFFPVNNAKISPILNNLITMGIISSEPIPKEENVGRGPGGFRYWLTQDEDNLLNVINSIYEFTVSDGSFQSYGNKFLKTSFSKLLLDYHIFKNLESELNFKMDSYIKDYILKILATSPTALLYFKRFQDTIFTNNLKNEDFGDNSRIDKNKIINDMLIMLTNALMFDTSNSLHQIDQDQSLSAFNNLKIMNSIDLVGLDGMNYKVDICIDGDQRDIKIKPIRE